ncbi:hypothetical protein [Streptomyces sp. NPDC048639]|uniref:hypothetical protein n=1 Tax=Streptomyces sp. NPDC048639 TaxID=3365581 RepID=UPI00371510AA
MKSDHETSVPDLASLLDDLQTVADRLGKPLSTIVVPEEISYATAVELGTVQALLRGEDPEESPHPERVHQRLKFLHETRLKDPVAKTKYLYDDIANGSAVKRAMVGHILTGERKANAEACTSLEEFFGVGPGSLGMTNRAAVALRLEKIRDEAQTLAVEAWMKRMGFYEIATRSSTTSPDQVSRAVFRALPELEAKLAQLDVPATPEHQE